MSAVSRAGAAVYCRAAVTSEHRAVPAACPATMTYTPDTGAENFESFERINSIRVTNGNSGSCNSCQRLGTRGLHELHELEFPFVTRIEYIRWKLSIFFAHVSGTTVSPTPGRPVWGNDMFVYRIVSSL